MMSYYENVNGKLYFKKDTPEEIVDKIVDDLQNEDLYGTLGDMDAGNNGGYIDFGGYGNYLSDNIENIIMDKKLKPFIKAAEVYVEGEESGDIWRLRLVEGEDVWRREVAIITYEGDDVRLLA